MRLARVRAASAPLLVTVLLLLAGCGDGRDPASSAFLVGAVEDAAKAGDGAAKMSLAQRAGFRAIVLSSVWRPPLTAPPARELAALAGAVDAAAAAGIRPIVAVYQFSGDTPTTAAARSQFAGYAVSIVRKLPAVRDVIVGNEPNLNLFWMPQFDAAGADAAAAAYLQLLAQTYDALKGVSPEVNVIGGALAGRGSDNPRGSRQTQSPSRFIEELGAAYRASGREKPLMDMFSLHPYPENSSIPPDFRHPRSSSIGLADYAKLVRLLGRAFEGTAQPGSSLPIIYGEYGLQSRIPPAKRTLYAGEEQASTKPLSETTQGDHYAEAIRIAACQPTVKMLLLFHVSDEPELGRLQTGLYYADDTPKASLAIVAETARQADAGSLKCRT